ncbi:HAD-IC family P-type ATPase [Candidatus Peregrinibacteria bacterium]|nr:HAD-IC family P-type ATPase [Candidatus Peregrinibacteria bacterium]
MHPSLGLTSSQAKIKLREFGPNDIPSPYKFTTLKILLSQFTSLLVIILIIAGTISILLKEPLDGIAIFAIVIINAIIGFVQEYKAENAIRALKKMVIPKTIVIRDQHEQEIPITDLVPEDIIILQEGDKIPADAELIEAISIKIDESMLTGESVPSSKNKKDKIFKGTIVTTGHGKAIITATGINTEFGKIIRLVSKEEETRSPLAIQLDELGKKVGIVILILVGIVFILGAIKGISYLHMLMTAVALGVSAIPEGMPIILTFSLATGVQVLARKKSGTLTAYEITVKKIFTADREMDILGEGYNFDEKIKLHLPSEKKLLEICENCNNSFVNKNILGDPTEIALKILARKADYAKQYQELDENIFTSDRKMMSTLNQTGSTKTIFAKGAFEEILRRSTHIFKDNQVQPLTRKDRDTFHEKALEYAKNALRVLGMAYKTYEGKFDENNLIFTGIVGMADPPRKSVKNSLKIAQEAGIRVIIITGDNAVTARAIGEHLGLKVHNVITGEEIDKLTDQKLKEELYKTEIFARTRPEHKYRIVDILQKNNEVVAVTGDGINDAPALKHADVGVAMGIKGTEASKEVSDIILKDDNFTTITNAIEEGRRIYSNILSFVKYLLSSNYDSVLTVGILTIMGYPLPLLPLQILWINLVTDALPALALGNSKIRKDTMTHAPHPKNENIFKKFFGFIMTAAIIQTLANIVCYFYAINLDSTHGIATANFSMPSYARTMVFTEIVLFELFFAFVCKEEKNVTLKSFFSNKSLILAVLISLMMQLAVIYVPFMQDIFKTIPLGPTEWLIISAFAATAFLTPAINNMFRHFFHRTK